jgi:DNA polymerase-3 subunit beta
MKLTLDRELLLTPLQIVMGVVERKQTLPILSNVLLDTTDNQIAITGTDLEVELVSQLPLDVDAKPSRLTVPGRKLMDICKALPSNAVIELSKEKDQVVVHSGRSRFTLSTLPADDFPSVDQPETSIQFEIKSSDLQAILQHCAFSMAQQDVRYYLNGLLLEVSINYIRAVATDGHRLAASTLSGLDINTQEKSQVIIPRKGVIELMRLLGSQEEPIKIEISENHIRAQGKSYKFTSKLIDGRFPDYERVIPKQTAHETSLDRQNFKETLSRVAILCNEKFRGLRFEFRQNMLRILANNPEQEAAEEEMLIDYTGEDADIGLNVSYLLDVLNALSGEVITLNFTDGSSSLMIEEVHDNIHCTYVVMPMRL